MNTSQEMPIQHILNSATPGDALAKAVSRHEDWLPSFLVDADTVPAGPLAYHSGSVLKHITRCMDAVAGDPLTVWMALAHDAGKLTTPSSLW
ncbi:MAG: hypothetical protein J5861_07705, partial [Desulfovibrio sp.]|nr:hypothetical protein [Desulfovibrio sp.]